MSRRGLCRALYLASCLSLGAALQVMNIGVTCSTLDVCARYVPIADYLTRELGIPFAIVPLLTDADTYAAAGNGSLDFMISNPTTFECVQIQFSAGGILSVVRNVSDSPVGYLGSSIVTLDSRTDINTLADVAGKKIGTARFSQLQGFQAQWGEFRAEGLDLFTLPAQLQIAIGQSQLTGLLTGQVDVVLVGTNSTISQPPYRTLASRTSPNYPFPTSTTLYPEVLFYWVNNGTNDDLLRAVQTALLLLEEGDPVLAPAMIWYFRSAFDYSTARTLLQTLGTLQNQSDGKLGCVSANNAYAFVACPPGFHRLSPDQFGQACALKGLPCPPGYQCICSPCAADAPTVSGLTVPSFAGVMVVVVALALALLALLVRRVLLRVQVIPYDQLDLSYNHTNNFRRASLDLDKVAAGEPFDPVPDVVASGRHGAVLHARYQGAEITLQRVCHRTARGQRGPFDVDGPAVQERAGVPRPWWRLRETLAAALTIPTDYRKQVVAVERLTRLRHDNLLPVLGVCRGEDKCEVLGVHSFCTSTLHGVLENPTTPLLPSTTYEGLPDVLLLVITDVVKAMTYLHHQARPPHVGISLQPTDLCMTHEYRVLVRVRHRPHTPSSPRYCSPEVLRGQVPDSASDVYAFGMLLYEILFGEEPFTDRLSTLTEDDLVSALSDPLTDQEPTLAIRPSLQRARGPEHLRVLMTRCWAQLPRDRPTFQQISDELTSERPGGLHDAMQMAARSERALKQFVPQHIIARQRLSDSRDIEAIDHPCVTLLMSDVENFTELSSRLHPRQVAAMLNRVWGVVDGLVAQYKLLKVDVAGDSYLCGGGILTDSASHAATVGRFALHVARDTRDVLVAPERPELGRVRLRIGLNSGPVVSSMIGATTPRWSLFGCAPLLLCSFCPFSPETHMLPSAGTPSTWPPAWRPHLPPGACTSAPPPRN